MKVTHLKKDRIEFEFNARWYCIKTDTSGDRYCYEFDSLGYVRDAPEMLTKFKEMSFQSLDMVFENDLNNLERLVQSVRQDFANAPQKLTPTEASQIFRSAKSDLQRLVNTAESMRQVIIRNYEEPAMQTCPEENA